MSSLFREKSLERVSSPDQLDDYVRVITPSVWVVLLAVAILVAGVIVWNALGTGPEQGTEGNAEPVSQVSMIDD